MVGPEAKAAKTAALKDPRIFVSYSHDDYDIARAIACHLQ
jgi:predicted nucleotide-binding protein